MRFREVILARGHENVLAKHRSTLEITKEDSLSREGDCIIAVAADKAVDDLDAEFTQSLCNENARLTILIKAGDIAETVNAYGSSKLILMHPTDMVVRKSNHVCSRTLAIKADKAACDLSRKLVERLKDSKQNITITLTVDV
jgi:hypothetical protein